MNTLKFIIFCIFVFVLTVRIELGISQDINEKIGTDELMKGGSNYYNYADKKKVNFEVNVWGYVRSPGKYLIPEGTTVIDLLTLTGGPLNDARLEDIRLVRLKNDSLNIKQNLVINLNYNDFLWEEKITQPVKNNPVLMPGDVILIPGSPRYTLRDNLSIILTATSVLTSVAILIVTILRK
jgi:hypothetical protein